MNCHNGERYLEESINSILKQTYKDWELIFGTINQLIIVKKLLVNLEVKKSNIFIQALFTHYINLEIWQYERQKENISRF